MKKGKKERKKERERKGEERKRKKAGVPSYEQASRDTPKKERGDPEYSIQENPRKQRKKGGGKGEEGGLSSPQVPTNLKNTLTAVVTLCPAKVAGCFDRCGHERREPTWNSIIRQVLAKNFGISLLRSLQATLVPGAGTKTHPRSTGLGLGVLN